MRDLTFVSANMDAMDRREIMCQVREESGTVIGLGSFVSSPRWRWVAFLGDEPVAAFGVANNEDFNPNIGHAWLFGTRKKRRSIPAVTRFATTKWPELLKGAGLSRLEVRALEEHVQARRWIEACGAEYDCHLPYWGKNGETFIQYAWTKDF